MEYRLFDQNDRSAPLTTDHFEDSFAAEQWARQWAASNGATDDYHIESSDGSHAARLFRTVGGQWYVMRQ
jgi:hypothetical protein